MLRGRGGVVGGEAAGVRTVVSLSMALLSPPSATPVSSARVLCARVLCVIVLWVSLLQLQKFRGGAGLSMAPFDQCLGNLVY